MEMDLKSQFLNKAWFLPKAGLVADGVLLIADFLSEIVVDDHAVSSHADGGLEQVAPRDPTECEPRFPHSSDLPRHRDRVRSYRQQKPKET